MPKSLKNRAQDVTRAGAAAILGASVATVRRAEERGDLAPRVDDLGIHWFDVGEVRTLAARRTRRARRQEVILTGGIGTKIASLVGLPWPFEAGALFERVERLREQVRAAKRGPAASSASAPAPAPARAVADRAPRVRAAG